MALFKNLYFDLGFMNLFRKKDNAAQDFYSNQPQPSVQQSAQQQSLQNQPSEVIVKKFRELPEVPKKLLEEKKEEVSNEMMPFRSIELPKIAKKIVMPPPSMSSQPKQQAAEAKIEQPIQRTEPKIEMPKQQVEPAIVSDDSFFSGLSSHISKEEKYVHNILSNQVLNKDLLGEMQSFWHNKKESILETNFNKALKSDLIAKMAELQKQEIEWQRLQLQNDKLEDELASKEILIENNVRQLKKTFKKLHVALNIKPEHYFILSNGSRLRNLQDLEDSLRNMPQEVFSFHVNYTKNDFANWINDVIGLTDLAQNVRMAKNKEQIISQIEKWYNYS